MSSPTEQPTSHHSPDPYELSPDAIQDPPVSFKDTLKMVGPGLILTASIVGTGELIATTNLGAKAGFALLWLVLLSCFIKVFVQIELGRYAISSGNTTLGSFKKVPWIGTLLCWWWFLMMILTQFQIGAMIGGSAQAIHLIFPNGSQILGQFINPDSALGLFLEERPEVPWAILVTAISIFILVKGRYHVVEGFSIWLVGFFTLLTVLCVIFLPFIDLESIPRPANASAPSDGGNSSGVWLAAFAMIGITGVGASELIAYPYWCLEKRYARNTGPREDTDSWLKRALGWMRVMHTDAWLSMIIYTLATMAFFVLGASVLFPHTGGRGLSQASTGEMLQELALMYQPVLGEGGALWFIAVGGFIVLFSTLFAATAGNSRVTTDFLRVQQLVPFQPQDYRINWIRFFSYGLPLFGLILYLFVGSPVVMVIIGGVAQAITLPMIAGVAIYVRLRHTDKRLVKKGAWDVFLWGSLIMFLIAGAWGIIPKGTTKAADEIILSAVKTKVKDTTEPFTLLVYLKAEPGVSTKLEETLAKAIPDIRKHPGNLAARLNRQKKSHYLLYQRWQNVPAIEKHFDSDQGKEFFEKLKDLLSGPPQVEVLLPVSE